jgi:hypothetical protein
MGSANQLNDFGRAMNQHFLLDPKYKNLNHGMSIRDPLQLQQTPSAIESLTSLLKAPSERILPLFEPFSTSTKPSPKLDPTNSTATPTHTSLMQLEPPLQSC